MKIIKQLFWIFLFSLLGEILSAIIRNIVAIPGSVIGMVLLFFALHFGVVKMEQVEDVGTWLTDNMAILFVPAGVGLLTQMDVLASVWWQLLIIMVVTVVVLLVVVGKVVESMTYKDAARNKREENK
ncbi:CidA/LrgA family protein [Aerococcaceae bacterium DSM 111022]|nr:CidA/LrgA family protein [Aerococcaceae bacterium DSM 111022]MBG9988345.1 CidA/LrgA family protein [Aerococcaceae bacterium DSM 111176]